MQGAAAYWLHHSLLQLQHALRDRLNTALVLRAADDEGGDSAAALLRLARESGASAVHYNAAYEPWRTDCDQQVSEALRARGDRAALAAWLVRVGHQFPQFHAQRKQTFLVILVTAVYGGYVG